MADFASVRDRLEAVRVLLLEERALLEQSDIGGLESLLVRKESAMLLLGGEGRSDASLPADSRVDESAFSEHEKNQLQEQFAVLRRENEINGALIEAAVQRSRTLGSLVAATSATSVYGERGRMRGPSAGTRLTRTA
jgi:flagellar biosynthesis/type III secretory pathway chaperone